MLEKLAPVRSWGDKVSEKMFVLCWTVWYSDSKYWSYFHKNFSCKAASTFWFVIPLFFFGCHRNVLSVVANCVKLFPPNSFEWRQVIPISPDIIKVIQLQYCTCYFALFLSWNQGLTQKYEKGGSVFCDHCKNIHDEVNTIDVVSFYIKWLCCYKKVYIQSVLWVQGKLATGDTCRHISANSSQVRVQNSLLVMETLWIDI